MSLKYEAKQVSKAVLAKSIIKEGTPSEGKLERNQGAALLDSAPKNEHLRKKFEGGREMMVPRYNEKRAGGDGWGWLW